MFRDAGRGVYPLQPAQKIAAPVIAGPGHADLPRALTLNLTAARVSEGFTCVIANHLLSFLVDNAGMFGDGNRNVGARRCGLVHFLILRARPPPA